MTQLWGTEVLAGCALQPWALDAGPGLLAAGAELLAAWAELLAVGAELQIPPSAEEDARTVGMTLHGQGKTWQGTRRARGPSG
jgi:hypothetical protein